MELATWKVVLKVFEVRWAGSTHLRKIKTFLKDPDR